MVIPMCDSDLSRGGSGGATQHYSGTQSYARKLLSRCRAYDQEPSLAFYLHDVFVARSFLCKQTVAENRGITPDITSDSTSLSESYW